MARLLPRFSFRLVYFPFVVMRTTSIDGITASGYDNADGWFLFNTLLFILLCLNVRARVLTTRIRTRALSQLTLWSALSVSTHTDLVVHNHREDHVAIDHIPKPPSAR